MTLPPLIDTRDWFYVEPYVHISAKRDGVLLYNTLNGVVIEDDYPPVVRLVKRLRARRSLLVVKLTSKEVGDGKVVAFVQKAREAFVGDVLSESFSRGRPIEMMPKLHVQRGPRGKASKDGLVPAGKDVMAYLAQISLYIINSCDRRCPSCRQAYRQFLACTRGTGHTEQLAVADIERLLEESKGSGLARINIVGGDIFQHSQFADLAEVVSRMRAVKVYVTHYANLVARGEYLSLIAADKNAELRILATFPLDRDRFDPVVPMLSRTGIHYGIDLIVQDESDLRAARAIVSDLKTERVSFKACFDGTNSAFLENVLFMSREDILDARPSLRDVFARMALNPLNFGKLVVFSDGTVRASANTPVLGRLGGDSLHELVYEEVVNGGAWWTLRTSVRPCKVCTYSLLCPPLTHYESVLGRSNLCHTRSGRWVSPGSS